MTEEKFTELVNLYLDQEISEQGLAALRSELAENAARKDAFRARCQLHQAMRLALNPNHAKRRRTQTSRSKASTKSKRSSHLRSGEISSSGSSRGSRRKKSRSSGAIGVDAVDTTEEVLSREPATVSTKIDERVVERGRFPRWIAGTGLAASFGIAFLLLGSVFRDVPSIASQPVHDGAQQREIADANLLSTIGRAELKRYAAIQEQRKANRRTSIAAQLRLMGLRPELTPSSDKALRSVSMTAAQRPVPTQDRAALLGEIQKMQAMPTPEFLHSGTNHSGTGLPSGFHSSLASFK